MQRPQTLRIRDNLPPGKRMQVNIDPKDPEFIETEKYFAKLLGDNSLTIDRILKDNFTAHEIEKFIPTNRDPMAAWQREDAIRYNGLLNTRFKGNAPTLPFKMAMLYYGLPVAPMKMMASQAVEASDFEDLEDDRIITSDPLSFLDEQGKRTYEDGPSTADRQIYGPPTVQRLDLKLRGGGLDDNEMELAQSEVDEDETGLVLSDMDDESSELWERQANDQLALFLRGGADEIDAEGEERESFVMYGREGNIECGFDMEDVLASICTLLHIVDAHGEVEVVVDMFQRDSEGAFVYLHSVQGPIYPREEQEEENKDAIVWLYLKNQLKAQHVKDGRVAFVRLPTDSRPTEPEPDEGQRGLVKLCHHDGFREMVGYLRTPSVPTEFHSPTQYASEFIRTLNVILPPLLHEFMTVTFRLDATQHSDIPLYLRQDPDPDFIKGIGEAFPDNCVPKFVLETTESISPAQVPIILPTVTYSLAHGAEEPLIMGKKGIASQDVLDRVVEHAISSALSSTEEPIAMQVWVPVESFQLDGGPHPSSKSVIIPLENGIATREGFRLWSNAIKQFAKNIPALYETGFAIVVRPIHSYYQFSDQSHQLTMDVPSLAISLKQFKDMVANNLYRGKYKSTKKNHVLRILQHDADMPYPIRFDTTEDEWTHYKQRITEAQMIVELIDDDSGQMEEDTRWDVDPTSYWGPCYDEPTNGQSKTTEDSSVRTSPNKTSSTSTFKPPRGSMPPPPQLSQPAPPAPAAAPARVPQTKSRSTTTHLYGKSNCGVLGPMSDPSMRNQSYWDAPSIFSNPRRPVMPIHAPPIETTIKNGPVVPGPTLGMRTGTEGALLQNQVHMLRGQLLDRVRECPYADCDKYFHYRDAEELDEHLKQDHPVVQCSLCLALNLMKDGRIPLLVNDPAEILHHFYTEHCAQFAKLCGHTGNGNFDAGDIDDLGATKEPRKPKTVDNCFCHRCGRDNSACHDAEDKEHHSHHCKQKTRKSAHCITCGSARVPLIPCPNDNCDSHSDHLAAAINEDHCPTCGFDLGGYPNKYRIQHRKGCKTVGGQDNDFCTHCGTGLRGFTSVQRSEHVSVCTLLCHGDDGITVERDETDENAGLYASDHSSPQNLKTRPVPLGRLEYLAARTQSALDQLVGHHPSPHHPGAWQEGDFEPESFVEDEEEDVVMSDEVAVGLGSPKKRKRHYSADPTYISRRGVEQESEEEISTMSATEEDYSILEAGAQDIPADSPSPVKKGRAKEKSKRVAPKKSVEGPAETEEAGPKPKRVKIVTRSKSAPLRLSKEDDHKNVKGKQNSMATPSRRTLSPTAEEVEEEYSEKAKPKTKATISQKPEARSRTTTPAPPAKGRDEAESGEAKPKPKRAKARSRTTTPAPARNSAQEEAEKAKPVKTKAAPKPRTRKLRTSARPLETAPQPGAPASSTMPRPPLPPPPTMIATRTSSRVRKSSAKVQPPIYVESAASDTPSEETFMPKSPKTAMIIPVKKSGRKKTSTQAVKTKNDEVEEELDKEADATASGRGNGRPKESNSNNSNTEVTDEQVGATEIESGINLD